MREFFKIFLISLFLWTGLSSPGFCGVGNTDNRFYVETNIWATEPYKNFVILEPCLVTIDGRWKETIFYGYCTAQYIAPNLILSAAHCLESAANVYRIENYKGEKFDVELVEFGRYFDDDKMDNIGDYAIFIVEDEKYYSDSFFDTQEPRSNTKVINAGWGWVRVLSDKELEIIREIVKELEDEYDWEGVDAEIFFDYLEDEMVKKGLKPLEDKPNVLKASECEIIFDNRSNLKRAKNFPDILGTTCDNWCGNSGGGYISKQDSKTLYGVCSYGAYGRAEFKESKNNDYMASARQFVDIVERLKKSYPVKKNAEYVKPSSTANAGLLDSTPLVSVNNSNHEELISPKPEEVEKPLETDDILNVEMLEAVLPVSNNNSNHEESISLKPEEIEKPLETDDILNAELLDSTPPVSNNNSNHEELVNFEPKPAKPSLAGNESINILDKYWEQMNNLLPSLDKNSENIQNGIAVYEEKVEQQAAEIESAVPMVPTMSNEETLVFANNLVEYKVNKDTLERLKELQKAYEEAKAKEQSKANRLLTAATVAATGIGGMQLAQGLAEQKADKDAEQDMNAYIATMRCEYGKGKSVKAGSEPIELPGGNDDNLMKYRNEYFTLAADLKTRKEALGMKAGIESEEILDKSQMGLYDDESTGITDGAYASLYRANMLNSEKDKQEIEDAKKTSKNRVVGGGVAAGAGVVGGVVGDALINDTFKKRTTSDNVKEE